MHNCEESYGKIPIIKVNKDDYICEFCNEKINFEDVFGEKC